MEVFCLLLLCALPSVAFSQSCPVARLINRPRTQAITDDFCSRRTPNVYIARVVGATCNCIPASGYANLYCQTYSFGTDNSSVINVETVSRARVVGERCNNLPSRPGVATCSELATSLTSSGITVKNITTDLPPVVVTAGYCNYSCPFNNRSSSEFISILRPCIYVLEVMTVFKGNYTYGETLVDVGPDLYSQYGPPNGRLQLLEEYVVGIGGFCSPIHEWSTVNSYSNHEISQLAELALRCGAQPVLPSLILLFGLTTVLSLI